MVLQQSAPKASTWTFPTRRAWTAAWASTAARHPAFPTLCKLAPSALPTTPQPVLSPPPTLTASVSIL